MKRRFKTVVFATIVAFSLTGCSLLPTLPTGESSNTNESSSNQQNDTYYTVIFDTNGGSYIYPQTVREGTTILRPSNPTKDGATFICWTYNQTEWDFSRKVYQDMTLTANWVDWTEATYSAYFYNEDGSFLWSRDEIPAGVLFAYEGPTPEKPEHLREKGYNYYFDHWDKDLIIYSDAEFYPVYRAERKADEWMIESTVPAEGNNVGYEIQKATDGSDRRRIVINVLHGTLAEGSSFRTGNFLYDNGFTKLTSNGMSVSYQFDLRGYNSGTMYMRATMDNWSSYSSRSEVDYYYTANTGTGDTGNFRMTFNDIEIDYSHMRGVSYGDLLNGGEDVFQSSMYAPVNDCEVGAVSLKEGFNTFTYTRVASYTLFISHFVIYLNAPGEVVHTHTFSDNVWEFNETAHWHPCTTCGKGKTDYANHTFGDWVTIPAARCEDATEERYCSVCGYKETREKPMEDHYSSHVSTQDMQDGFVQASIYECSNCHKQAYRWSSFDYNEELSNDVERGGQYIRFATKPENRDGVEQRGAHIVYKVNMPQAASNVSLSFNIIPSNATGGYPIFNTVSGDSYKGYEYSEQGQLVQATKRYGLWVNGTKVILGDDPYPSVINSSQAWYNWPVTFNLKAGENTIDICCYGSYRARMYMFQIVDISL